MTEAPSDNDLLDAVSTIVSAYVVRNSISPTDLVALISETHRALRGLNHPVEPPAPPLTPAVSVRKSITDDYLISLEDGRKFKSLKRHLGKLGMTPDEYRQKWGLPSDYPMVSASYSATRSSLAKSNGLGRKATTPRAPRKKAAAQTA